MNITDYENGSAFVKIPRRAFKDQQFFDSLLSFLKLTKDCNTIEIKVNQRYSKLKPGGLSHMELFEQNYKGY